MEIWFGDKVRVRQKTTRHCIKEYAKLARCWTTCFKRPAVLLNPYRFSRKASMLCSSTTSALHPGTSEIDIFDDFVARHLVEDYKRLHTQPNPFRFRVQIVAVSESMLSDPAMVENLSLAYHREGRASGFGEARDTIFAELGEVLRVFSSLDEHLETIENISRDMERRLRNTVRHLERVSVADTGPVARAMLVLGRVGAGTVPAGPLGLLLPCVPLGPAHLFQKPRCREPPARRALRVSTPDPAFLAFQVALLAYQQRMDASPERIRTYLEEALPAEGRKTAVELPLSNLDDFVAFHRLTMLGWLDDPLLSRDFGLELLDGCFSNDWIACSDFAIKRKGKGGMDA